MKDIAKTYSNATQARVVYKYNIKLNNLTLQLEFIRGITKNIRNLLIRPAFSFDTKGLRKAFLGPGSL